MKRLDKITPEGTKDLLFEEYEQVKDTENTLIKIFKNNGYHGLRTPAVEFFDVFSDGIGEISQQEMYSLSDYRGRIMVLRPDSTKPVARLVATRLKDAKLPLRLYYNQCVYKRNKSTNLMSDEIRQTGIELIGEEGEKGDIEALLISAKCLLKTCGKKFMLEIGHMGIFKELIDSANIDSELKESVRRKIETKNYPSLSTLLEKQSGKKSIEALMQIPALYGGIEVLEKAESLIDSQKAKDILTHIKNIYNALSAEGFKDNLAIDLGLINGYGYYSGLVFKGYAHGMGEAVLSGGRYDTLYSDYGLDFPAIGFAINTELLLKQKAEKTEDNIADKPLTIVLTKGRLEEKTKELLIKAGIDCTALDQKGRKLIVPLCNGSFNIVFAKAGDVITYIEHGVCDIGVVGKDTIMEQGQSFYEMLDLGFGKCRFVLAGVKGKDFYEGYGIKKVATKYPAVAAKFFESKKMDVDIIKIDGSVELAPILKLADGIIDIAETGITLKENGLEVKEEIADISARLIVNTASLKIKRQRIENFIELLKGAMKK